MKLKFLKPRLIRLHLKKYIEQEKHKETNVLKKGNKNNVL